MATPPERTVETATILMPGHEDPVLTLASGRLSVEWSGGSGARSTLSTFQEKLPPRVVNKDLLLPTLYLHFLDPLFHVSENESCLAMRSGNDNSEIQLALPLSMVTAQLSRVPALATVVQFLERHGSSTTSSLAERASGFSPQRHYKATVNAGKLCFDLKTSRPKADVNLDKSAFGIPLQADLYLFAENHASILYATRKEKEAFSESIVGLLDGDREGKRLGVFLKILLEGGFAYNKKNFVGAGGYLPKNVGVACMSTVPAFEGQTGISTGYPFKLDAGYLSFTDTVPVTIEPISDMSPLHKRYALCFTRCIHLTRIEGETPSFFGIVPYGGFYYMPATPELYAERGALVYAFGESAERLSSLQSKTCLMAEEEAEEMEGDGEPVALPTLDDSEQNRTCTICLNAKARVATIPCGHLAFCSICAAPGRCPVCRGQVTGTQRVYL